jgi:hypothetical protein
MTVDLNEARRSAERWLVQDAYDYALAKLGYTRKGAELIGPHGPGDYEAIVGVASAKLLRSAESLAAASVVDARLVPLDALDAKLRPKAHED